MPASNLISSSIHSTSLYCVSQKENWNGWCRIYEIYVWINVFFATFLKVLHSCIFLWIFLTHLNSLSELRQIVFCFLFNLPFKLQRKNLYLLTELGSFAGPLIQANGRLTFEDDLRSGGLLYFTTQ